MMMEIYRSSIALSNLLTLQDGNGERLILDFSGFWPKIRKHLRDWKEYWKCIDSEGDYCRFDPC